MKIFLGVTIDPKAMLPFMAVEQKVVARGKFRANILSELLVFLNENHKDVLDEFLALK